MSEKDDNEEAEQPTTASLNVRQRLFVSEYLKDQNATQAYIRAGYAAKAAGVCGPQLLGNPSIRAAIDDALDAREARTLITADRVLRELGLLAFSDVSHYEIDDAGHVALTAGAPKAAMRAVSSIKRKRRTFTDKDGMQTSEVEVELKLWDKPNPLKLAGQHVGLFRDKPDKEDGPPVINVYTGIAPPAELGPVATAPTTDSTADVSLIDDAEEITKP
jgi:phage terminase small subunit